MKLLYIYAGKETDKKRIGQYFKDLELTIEGVKRKDTEVEIRGLEGKIPEEEEAIFWYSHPYITVGMIELIKKINIGNYDGILIGCVGSHDAEYSLREILNIPVIDPVEAGIKYIEMLIDLHKSKGILQSKVGTYMGPETWPKGEI